MDCALARALNRHKTGQRGKAAVNGMYCSNVFSYIKGTPLSVLFCVMEAEKETSISNKCVI